MKHANSLTKSFISFSKYLIATIFLIAQPSVALAVDAGLVKAWGVGNENHVGNSQNWAQSIVPADLGPCIQISAGEYHTVAIQENGAVRAWGAGTTDNLSGENRGQSIIPANLGPCIQISAGHYHTLAIQVNGTVKAWGAGLNTSYPDNWSQSVVPSDLGICSQISAGDSHSVALKADGTVVAWGQNTSGQCDVPIDLGACIQIAAGEAHTVALKANGTVRAWGLNQYGQCTLPVNLGVCSKIDAGRYHTAALQANGSVKAWGNNQFDQCTIPSNLGVCIQIAVGAWDTVALEADGTVKVWGYNPYGVLINPVDLGICTQISCGWGHVVAIQGPPTTITGVIPVSGPSLGGTAIKINGTNFHSPATVAIGGALATNVVVVSSTLITAVTPPGLPGMAVVTVDFTNADAFYYRPTCGSDIDNNGVVDSADLGIVLLDFGNCSESLTTPQPEPMIFQTAEPATPVLNKK